MAPSSAPLGSDFLVTVAGINRGRAATEASRKLAEVTKAVTENGGKGKITLTLEVARFKGSDANVEVKAKVTATAPQPEHGAVFFFDQDFNLTRDDPSMEPLFARTDVQDGGQR